MKITKFEDIKAWQIARELVNVVYHLTTKGKFQKDYGLKEQTQRAAVSTMANIAEGFDSQSDTEFIKFLTYARRSATEVQSHLYVGLDQKYISDTEFNDVFEKAKEGKILINGFIRFLKKTQNK